MFQVVEKNSLGHVFRKEDYATKTEAEAAAKQLTHLEQYKDYDLHDFFIIEAPK